MRTENFDIRVYNEVNGEVIEKLYTINGEELNQFIYTFMGDVVKMEDGDFVGIPYPLYRTTDATITFTKEYDKIKITFNWRTNVYEYQSFDYYVDTFEDFNDIITDWNRALNAAEQTNKEHILLANKRFTNRKHYLSKIS